jgi:hypothetical protein
MPTRPTRAMTPPPSSMHAFEIESFIPSSPSSSGSSNSSRLGREDCRRVARRVPRRIVGFVAVICFLAFLALMMNVLGSLSMIISPFDTKDEVNKKGNRSTNPISAPRTTPSPTMPPTHAPSKKQIQNKSPLSTGSTTGNSQSQSGATHWFDPKTINSSNHVYPPTPHPNNNNINTNNSNASQAFVERWCDLQGVDWYPTGTKAWQQRGPAFLLPGAKMSGTKQLAAWLLQHSQIVAPPARRSSELQFFYERNFRRYVTAQERTKVKAARERMYARDFSVTPLKKSDTAMEFDATPGYLFYSSILPRRILCVAPWIKLVVLLRDPVDRVAAHYAEARRKGLKLTLEEWIDKEFALLDHVGLLNHTTSIATANAFSGSTEEDVAWYHYHTATLEGALGRGMYEIQLRQWFQALRAVGRDPADSVLIVRSEHLHTSPAEPYRQMLTFLGLSTQDEQKNTFRPALLGAESASTHLPMKEETRQRLTDFYAPYNARLQSLVQSYRVRMLT